MADLPPASESELVQQTLLSALEASRYACSSLHRLQGGSVNFVFRGILKQPLSPSGESSIIIRHSVSHLARNENFKLAVERCYYETLMLQALSDEPAIVHENFRVRTPRIYYPVAGRESIDVEGRARLVLPPNTIIMEDLGLDTVSLQSWLGHYGKNTGDSTTSSSRHQQQLQCLGVAIGAWLARLHQYSNPANQAAVSPKMIELRDNVSHNKAMKKLKWAINMGRYARLREEFPHLEAELESAETYTQIAKEVRTMTGWESEQEEVRDGGEDKRSGTVDQEQAGPGRYLLHGDFWAGNVVLGNGPLVSSTHKDGSTGESPPEIITIFVIDFEFSHLGSAAQDLGQFFAELVMGYNGRTEGKIKVDKSDPNFKMMGHVAEGYLGRSLPRNSVVDATPRQSRDRTFALEVAMHMGIHLAVFPWNIGRPRDEKMDEIVRMGNELLVRGWRKDEDWFVGGILERLFRS